MSNDLIQNYAGIDASIFWKELQMLPLALVSVYFLWTHYRLKRASEQTRRRSKLKVGELLVYTCQLGWTPWLVYQLTPFHYNQSQATLQGLALGFLASKGLVTLVQLKRNQLLGLLGEDGEESQELELGVETAQNFCEDQIRASANQVQAIPQLKKDQIAELAQESGNVSIEASLRPLAVEDQSREMSVDLQGQLE